MKKDEASKAKNRQRVLKALTMVFQLALSAVCPIILLILLGTWLDSKYGNGHHIFTLAGAFLGIYSAYRSTWLLLRDNFLKKTEKSQPEDKEIKDNAPAENEALKDIAPGAREDKDERLSER